ncbi:MAG: hypothetical protein U5R06_12530 [candidate division KSB1 bacterium]|nr:hypothetical protein [candidate division KSB1 bacterium]
MNTLQSVVGPATYNVWTSMLQHLISQGRTHRLALIIAGMLQYATIMACQQNKKKKDSETVAGNLQMAEELNDFEVIKRLLSEPLEQLFDDSNAKHERTDYRGNHYSIIDSAIHEYINWYDMPWES